MHSRCPTASTFAVGSSRERRRGRGRRHLRLGPVGAHSDMPRMRRTRRRPARRRPVLPHLPRGDDEPGLRSARRMSHHGHAHGHNHGLSEGADSKHLARGLALIVGVMVVEVVAGILAHSLALLSDAAHMLTDAGALLLALVVTRLVRRPAGGNLTFGLRRLDALSAQANGATLLVLAGLIVYGGVNPPVAPPGPRGG